MCIRDRSSTWSASQLNTLNLNQNYLSNIGSKWGNLIALTIWQVGGAETNNLFRSPIKTAYTYEVGANKLNTTYSAKIGLMYVSDYGYAASPDNWNTKLGNYGNTTVSDNNWMFMGLYEWTISRVSDYGITVDSVFLVNDIGGISIGGLYNHVSSVRPVFYLNSAVQYVSGTGTQTDPYRIA